MLCGVSSVTQTHGYAKVRHLCSQPRVMLMFKIGAAGFVAAAARKLPQPDVWCIMYPSLRTLLQCDVLELDDASILSSVSVPVSLFPSASKSRSSQLSRNTLSLAKSAALQNTPAGFWKIAPSRSSAKSGFIKAAITESTDRCVE